MTRPISHVFRDQRKDAKRQHALGLGFDVDVECLACYDAGCEECEPVKAQFSPENDYYEQEM